MVGEQFTVIIVNYNGSTLLMDCVRSVLAENVPVSQVTVVDNGSQDESIGVLESQIHGVQIIRNSCNAGFARAVNQGLRRVGTEFALLLNNDAQLQPGALRAFAQMFARKSRVAFAGGQLFYPDGRQQNSVAAIPTAWTEVVPKFFLKLFNPARFSGKAVGDQPKAVESVIGACLAVRVTALPDVGLLDEDFFFYMEETEWCMRAQRRGYMVYYVPEAKAIHIQGKSANAFRTQARIEYHRSRLLFFEKTETWATLQVLYFIFVTRSITNVLTNSLLCLLTLCLSRRQRLKTLGYWTILLWYAAGRPRHWGLPGKCSASKIEVA